MLKINYNNSYKDNIYLGIAIAFWLVFFLIYIAPFDIVELSFSSKLYLVPPYGIFFLISYMLAVFFQRLIIKKWGSWNVFYEIGFILFTCTVNLFLTYFYYTTPFMNGDFSISLFIRIVYVPITVLIASLLLFGRMFIARKEKKSKKTESTKIALVGESKNDVLYVEPDQILSISSAQNYVEVYYKQNEKIHKHLIRGSLKRVASELDFLIQVHRSHVINPHYIVKWVDAKTLQVDERMIPISKTYKTSLIELINSIPNKSHLVPKAP